VGVCGVCGGCIGCVIVCVHGVCELLLVLWFVGGEFSWYVYGVSVCTVIRYCVGGDGVYDLVCAQCVWGVYVVRASFVCYACEGEGVRGVGIECACV